MEKYTQLKKEERERFFVLKTNGLSMEEIAMTMGRHKSALYRELNRNSSETLGYLPDNAHQMAIARKSKVLGCKRCRMA